MYDKLQKHLQKELDEIRQAGLFKEERIIASPQGAEITLADGRKVINFCANNYLGLADSPELIAAAKAAMDARGYGMSSVRFICGTQDIHKNLEKKIAEFYGMEDAILYAACFDANGGVFEPLFDQQDAIISDALNHASIIDGVRLCKAARYRYANNDMDDLEKQLQEADRAGSRFKIVVTDGVFSMDGVVANLRGICDLTEKYDALVMVDESHAAGFIGRTGRGTIEYCGVEGRVDIVTGTLGKALGGAMGDTPPARKRSSRSCANVPVPTCFPIRCARPSSERLQRPSKWSWPIPRCATARKPTLGVSRKASAASDWTSNRAIRASSR